MVVSEGGFERICSGEGGRTVEVTKRAVTPIARSWRRILFGRPVYPQNLLSCRLSIGR